MLILSALAMRVMGDGRSEVARCEAALARGDLEAAIVHARHGAAAYVPLAGHVTTANDLLSRMATEAEAKGDFATALFAWRSMRAASLGSRRLGLGRSPWRTRAEAAISRLLRAGAAPGGTAGPAVDRLDLDPPPHGGLLWLRILAGACVLLAGGRFGLGALSAERPCGWRDSAKLGLPFILAVLAWVAVFLS